MIAVIAFAAQLLAGPAEASPYSKEQLDALVGSSEEEYARFQGRCETLSSPPDREAEQAFARMAEVRQLVVLYYPYGKKDQKIHSDDVRMAVQLYERAYRCNPGQTQRGYIDKAFELVQARIRQIRDVERRPDTAEDYAMLVEEAKRLRETMKAIPPMCVTSAARPCPKPQPIVQTAETKGYRGRYMGLFSLRVEVGAMFATNLKLPTTAPDGSLMRGITIVLFSVAPGVRLLAGKKQRHVFGLGFRYTAIAYDNNGYSRIDRVAARFEYGIRAHRRWFSIHGGFEPGVQSHWESPNFGHTHLDFWGGVCTWNEAVCARVGWGLSALPKGSSTYLEGGLFSAGLDLFRVADNVLRAIDGEKSP